MIVCDQKKNKERSLLRTRKSNERFYLMVVFLEVGSETINTLEFTSVDHGLHQDL